MGIFEGIHVEKESTHFLIRWANRSGRKNKRKIRGASCHGGFVAGAAPFLFSFPFWFLCLFLSLLLRYF
jgi:hypothetical protein